MTREEYGERYDRDREAQIKTLDEMFGVGKWSACLWLDYQI